ncbi:LANO_0B03290g1_1 [Lachancea nothofagi CBS 11611]|uniref:LANO_0B03290g1_1 n=1 Tax=Lachancea nothofagi CBS 11611 TaxID=1266666 RepID=A0A1G4IWS8_9SACH|nr:LANO_0B03290g1_1 [Lachancea nothofagi CBS 11611]
MDETRPSMLFGTRDILVEHQRGMTVLGYPVFSPNLLIRGVDPPQFQLIGPDGESVEKGEIKAGAGMWPLDLNSRSGDFKWFVSMDHANRYETDDQGWSYGWRFRSKRWKASNGFVRKRFWVRLRERTRELTPAEPELSDLECGTNPHVDEGSTTAESEHSSIHSQSSFSLLLQELSKPSLDRQKADRVLLYISQLPSSNRQEFLEPNSSALRQILERFQFDESRRKLVDVQIRGIV